jgi:hypothetical protein
MAMTTANTIPWNLVTKNLQDSELPHKKLQEKITKLEKHLKRARRARPQAGRLEITI